MKKLRHIFIKFFLLIVLFFFQGISAHSGFDTERYYSPISLDAVNTECSMTPDNDSSDEDLIEQSDISDLSDQDVCQKFSVSTLPLLNILFVSVWQPPKIF